MKAVDTVTRRPRVQSLWAAANRRADQLLVTIVNGGKGPGRGQQRGRDARPPPDLDHGGREARPAGQHHGEDTAGTGNLTLFKSDKLSLIEDLGNAIRHLALLFSILVPALWAFAILLARGRRRRTLMSVGFSMAIAGVLGVAGRHVLQTAVVNTIVHNDAQRPAARATIAIGTQILAEIAIAFILVGIVTIVAAWFAGPARPAVAGRRAIAPFLRERPGWAFAIVLSVMVLLFIWQPIHALGTPVGIVVFLCLALLGTELLRRQTEIEFPGAQPGDASAAMRARVAAFRDRRQQRRASAAALVAARPARAPRVASRPRCDHRDRVPRGEGQPAEGLAPDAEQSGTAAAPDRRGGRALSEIIDGADSGIRAPRPRRRQPLDRRTRTLVRLAALLALGAPTTSVQWAAELASTNGADVDAIAAVLLASARAAGSAQVVESAPRLALALGFDVELDGWDGS